MLESRVLATLQYYDLQDLPLTAFEVYRFLLADKEVLQNKMDQSYELIADNSENSGLQIKLDTVLTALRTLENEGKLLSERGFYHLPNRQLLVQTRLVNYFYGLKRERYIGRYMWLVKFLPFVRGVALGGSQAMGLNRPTSDIDLLVITHPKFMWLCRTLMSVYFQVIGLRRHGNKIANRFCLNHYLSNIREVDAERNLYKAMEYTRLRPITYPQTITAFQFANLSWIRVFMPNFQTQSYAFEEQNYVQNIAEKLLNNRLGLWLEERLKAWQSARIRQDQFVFIRSDELSFHPESKHEQLLRQFFS